MRVFKKSSSNLAFVSFFLFFLSPFIALPFILIDIYNKRRGSYFLLAMFMGVLAFLLLPHTLLDVSRYYENYDLIARMSFSQFIEYLGESSDYVFYSLFYFFSRFDIKFQWVLFIFSTFNYYSVFFVFKKIISTSKVVISKKELFIFFTLIFFSLSLLYYLSGTRYTLATSFFILFVYYYYYEKSIKKGILCFVISVITHIGLVIYLPILFLLLLLKKVKKITVIKCVCFAVVVFSVIPINFLLLPLEPFLPSLVGKINAYIMFEQKEGNWISSLTHLTILFTALYVLFIFNRFLNRTIFNMVMLCIVAVALTLPFGHVVYDRYVLILKPILVFAMIYLYIIRKEFDRSRKIKFEVINRVLLASFLLYTIFAIYFYRESITPYFKFQNWFFVTLIDLEYTFKDFLK
ncbi:EpsG family protein [Myroides sp. M-43]|uniref:EpsG family protein n=1 Tax=Myroides oncorhynchi TaxID=2893756 RepID=UPI001E49BE55|nr:EpsG family protein [Myroides oncorhynchi]MCC9043602.1 EpsG family protein [Myroides oncorhynchi]